MLMISRRAGAMVLAAGLMAGLFALPAAADPLNPYEFPSLGNVTLGAGSYTLNTDTMQLSGGTLVLPLTGTLTTASGGRGIAVFSFGGLTISKSAAIAVTGGRMCALLSTGDMSVLGTIDASGGAGSSGGSNSGSTPGAGGAHGNGVGGGLSGGDGGAGAYGSTADSGVAGYGGSGNGAGAGGVAGVSIKGGGGGGGGFGGAGGNNANSSYGDILARLEAGSSGGGGGGSRTGNSANGGTGGSGGGAGGGAIELGAMGTLLVDSSVTCKGGDGAPGIFGFGAGGGGGGSGGAILLHGTIVTLGTVNANGGNGGTGGIGGPGGNGGTGGGGGGGRVAIQSTGTPSMVNVSATGANAGVVTVVHPAISVAAVEFGEVAIGESKTVFMAARNMGDAGSCINGVFPVASGEYARVGTGVFSSLKAGGASACAYTFTPSSLGASQQTLQMVTNAGVVQVVLRGTGTALHCPGDLDNNGMVDDADFSIFVVEYNELLCP